MKNLPLFPIAIKLKPELKNLDGSAGLQAFTEVLTVVYQFPFSIVGSLG